MYLKVKDYSVSGELFELKENETYGYLETVPQPNLDLLPNYYQSENYISHTDSKRNLFEKVYHLVRIYALRKKLKLANSFVLESKTLLDIGCGTGDFLEIAKRDGWKINGIEPNKKARRIANSKTGNVVYDTQQLLKFETQSFDVITLWHVLEHLPNLEEQVLLIKKLLKPSGTLIIAVPNYKSYDASYYKEFWAAFDVPRHLWHFNKKSIASLFNKVSLKVFQTRPMYFDAFYVSLLSEKYKTGKMNLIRAFFIGMLSNVKSMQTKEVSSLIYILKSAIN